MEEKIISNYNSILLDMEKIILSTKNIDLKNHTKSLYKSYIINVAKREQKDLNYYKTKLELLDIDSDEINKILEEIKSRAVYYTPVKNTDKISASNKDEDVLSYIFENVYGNKNHDIGIKHEKLVRQLREEFKNPNELSIVTWVNNYMEYVKFYSKELDSEKLISYMKILFKECDKEGIYYNNIDKYIKGEYIKTEEVEEPAKTIEKVQPEESKEEKGLKILSIKRPKNKKVNKFLKASALIGLWSTVGLGNTLVVYGLYMLYKKNGKVHDTVNEKLNNIFAKFGFKINNEQNLVDEEEQVVSEERVEKERTGLLKKALIKLNSFKENGFIKKTYKKNKLTSLLLNNKLIERMKNKVVVPDAPLKDEENKLILKGMGNC